MLDDYSSQILKVYQKKKKEGTLSVNLLHPTPGKLKDECMIVYPGRNSSKDLDTLRHFFNLSDKDSDYYRAIRRFDIDRFRPLIHFMNNRVVRTSDRNIELLAWLIDFEPRPYIDFRFGNISEESVPSDQISVVAVEKEGGNGKSFPNGDDSDGVFISYSWDSEEHKKKVISFTDHLRRNGFPAKLDEMLNQQETAINFVKMMHKAMHEHSKIIVVLSEGYKRKAESFTGGVGEEYQILINDINTSPTKYILVSFEGRSEEIIPIGLRGRNIIDLSSESGEEILFRKLTDQVEYVFSPVASEKPKLPPRKISEFTLGKKEFSIEIEEPLVIEAGNQSKGSLYLSLKFILILNFRNLSSVSIDGFAYEIRILQQLLADDYMQQVPIDGHFLLTESMNQKVFPTQNVKSKAYNITISSDAKYQIIGSVISITVFTDHGSKTKIFTVNELFKVSPANQSHIEKQPLARKLFW